MFTRCKGRGATPAELAAAAEETPLLPDGTLLDGPLIPLLSLGLLSTPILTFTALAVPHSFTCRLPPSTEARPRSMKLALFGAGLLAAASVSAQDRSTEAGEAQILGGAECAACPSQSFPILRSADSQREGRQLARRRRNCGLGPLTDLELLLSLLCPPTRKAPSLLSGR